VETQNISARIAHRPTGNGITSVIMLLTMLTVYFPFYHSVHGEIGSLSMMGVSRESHDTVIITTPETRENTGNHYIIHTMMSSSYR